MTIAGIAFKTSEDLNSNYNWYDFEYILNIKTYQPVLKKNVALLQSFPPWFFVDSN